MPKRDEALKALAKGSQGKEHDVCKTLIGGVSCFFGFDSGYVDKLMQCWREEKPFVHLDHAYFQRGYNGGNFRVNVGHFHQTGLLDVSDDRLKKLGVGVEPWKKGREVLVITPSQRICQALGVSGHWAKETAARIRKYTDRPIRIKDKGPGLLGELKDCHAVVSLSSVAEVEAAKYGIPVFATEHSPASPIAEKDFSKIEAPIYPEREMWLRSLSYSQWHVSELKDGTTRRHLARHYPDLGIVD